MPRVDFDVAGAPENKGFELLPKGRYKVVATESEIKVWQSGEGRALKFTMEVVDGPMKGRKFFPSFTIWSTNADAEEIGKSQFADFCRAAGFAKAVQDSEQLHNKPVLADVYVKVDKKGKYDDSNAANRFYPVGTVSPGGAPRPHGGRAATPNYSDTGAADHPQFATDDSGEQSNNTGDGGGVPF